MTHQGRYATLALVLAAGGCLAQDSVSRNANGGNGLPGDALAPWASVYQRTSYVVDLAPINGSWGTPFGIAPVLKASRINGARFSAANIAPTISASTRTGTAYPSSGYTLWTQAGGGLHTSENNPALNSTFTPGGAASVFGVAALDVDETLSGTSLYLANVAYGAQIAYDPASPSRLLVTRVLAAHNATTPVQPDRSQFGLGSIDADGNLCFRADSFNSAGPSTSLLQGDNYFRVRLPARGTLANTIDNTGGSQAIATDWIMQQNAVTHAVPSAMPSDIASRSVLVGADFAGRVRSETTPNSTTTTTSHRPGTFDHRGSTAVGVRPVFAGSVATGALLTRSTGGGGKVDSLGLFGLDSTGAVTGAATLTIPATVLDACDAFPWPMAGGGFRGYDSQALFRGGAGQVAIGRDGLGRGLAASVLYQGTVPDPANPFNAIVVVRFDPANPQGTAQWTAAAWVDGGSMDGKDILGDFGQDGAPGTGDAGEGDGAIDGLDAPIGRLASISESTLGLVGPSLSMPGMDAAGNLYFISSASLKRWNGTAVVNDYELALIRAVYDPASLCYRLELLLRAGAVVSGQNSGRAYRVAGLNLSDSDSASSASVWSSSVSSTGWNNADPATLPVGSPLGLGGLVLTARIVYDANQDGFFEDPTLPGSDSASPDEAYNATMYVGNITPAGPGCDGDVNCDGNLDGFDVLAMELAVGGDLADFCQPDADFNHDGNLDGFDVMAVELVVGGGACP